MNINYRDLLTHLGKPFASGLDREVFYSEKYNVVVKKRRSNRSVYTVDQMKSETKIFLHMTDDDFDVFPIIDVVIFHEQPFIVMEPCKVFRKIPYDTLDTLNQNILRENKRKIDSFIDRFEIFDLHEENMAVRKNGYVCVIDAGLNFYTENKNSDPFPRNNREIIKLRRIP